MSSNNGLGKYIDHTVLYAYTPRSTIEQFCKEAVEYGFAAVCFNPTHVKFAADLLKGTPVKVCTVIGFPLGASTSNVKAFETKDAIANGAQEVDMVINIGAVKDGDFELVEQDIRAVVDAAAGQALVKVIIETCLLSDEEKVRVCELGKRVGVDFVKTSSGFSTGGTTSEDVALMKETVGPAIGVKASTGVRTEELVLQMVKAGASRIGTGSGIQIVNGIKK
ncbi:deoxyribose-phosphate aldolase [Paenibacillus psychroresistens]|uniref:Deoxyribose-phosphate aldolase n=1 Tax=Paenibacillus psychroresistens TaxID=1778678 RepID=A0A6B8RDJ7_9BACL|nr:deoxyribose-phosphate aldolase [Paenibacillus psychroresistens]QGQ94279.1 deoxyribose-phosphate aldolase [Paenibacillus psychroresistens]